MQNPKEAVLLAPGETYTVKPKRAHLVTNAGETSAVFLVLQGLGEYDFVPITKRAGAAAEITGHRECLACIGHVRELNPLQASGAVAQTS